MLVELYPRQAFDAPRRAWIFRDRVPGRARFRVPWMDPQQIGGDEHIANRAPIDRGVGIMVQQFVRREAELAANRGATLGHIG